MKRPRHETWLYKLAFGSSKRAKPRIYPFGPRKDTCTIALTHMISATNGARAREEKRSETSQTGWAGRSVGVDWLVGTCSSDGSLCATGGGRQGTYFRMVGDLEAYSGGDSMWLAGPEDMVVGRHVPCTGAGRHTAGWCWTLLAQTQAQPAGGLVWQASVSQSINQSIRRCKIRPIAVSRRR